MSTIHEYVVMDEKFWQSMTGRGLYNGKYSTILLEFGAV
jgi:hypothetical protein